MTCRFDEFTEQAIDFTDPDIVADYDRKQRTALEGERSLAGELDVSEGQIVIEFGPGTGALSIAMAERGARVHAVHTSAAMLTCIQKYAEKAGLAGISTHRGGFLTYEHEGRAADLVVTKFALHHLPDFWKTVAFTRIRRMLRPGGRIYIHDVIFSFAPGNYQAALDEWIDAMTSGPGWSREEFETHVNEEYSTFDFVLEGLLEASGLPSDTSNAGARPTPPLRPSAGNSAS